MEKLTISQSLAQLEAELQLLRLLHDRVGKSQERFIFLLKPLVDLPTIPPSFVTANDSRGAR